MTIFVGESLTFKVAATSPVDGHSITDAAVTVEFYAPGLNPATTLADRVTTGANLVLTYSSLATGPTYEKDRVLGAYVGHRVTTGMAAGKWSYRAHIQSSTYDSWEYGTFVLKA
jgi:hypothetical protein